MKTIKVIDLLNKIANGEEIPKKVKHNSTLYHFNREYMDYESDIQEYRSADVKEHYYLFTEWCPMILNDEVELIEEDKEIKPLCKLANYKVNTGDDFLNGVLTGINKRINELIEKQSEVIDVVNELKKGK